MSTLEQLELFHRLKHDKALRREYGVSSWEPDAAIKRLESVLERERIREARIKS